MPHPRTLRVLPLLAVVALAACEPEPRLLEVESLEPDTEEASPTPPRMNPQSMAVEGYPTTGEIREGWIADFDGTPRAITYEIHDGLAIWQGDIVLGTPDEVARTPAELGFSNPGPLRGVAIDGASFRWPGGVIPYEIAGDLPNQVRVTNAIDIIEDQTPGVTLVPRSGEADYVRFVVGTGCSSAIGRQSGQQNINLAGGCTTGNTAHEILHALGMYHEHTRCDRDGFVTIDYDEIEAGKEGNFFKAGSDAQGDDCGDDQAVTDYGAYDFGSMMHYPLDAFAIGTENTIIPIAPVPAGTVIGQRSAVGPTDAETIDILYGANNAAPTVVVDALAASYPEGTPVPFDASASTDADDDDDLLAFSWTFGDGASSSDANAPHPYADNGTYPYSVTVSDGFDASAFGTTIDITNVAPAVSAGAPTSSVDEGTLWARNGSFTDPGTADTWGATVDYDDGGGVQALALTGKNFSLSNTWVDNGVNTVVVEVTDDDGGVGDDQIEVTVNNVAPTVDAGPDAVVESGESLDFSGTFSDPGVIDSPWEWVIEWGDGSPDTDGSTDDQGAAIEASHQVCIAGDYTVTLTVTDKDGGVGDDDLTVSVPYIPMGIDIMPGTSRNPVNLKKKGSLTVAVLGSAELDVTEIDAGTLTLGDEAGADVSVTQKKDGTYQVSVEDVNGDGFPDLVAHFATDELVANGDLTELSTELVLRAFLDDACTNLRGVDAVDPT